MSLSASLTFLFGIALLAGCSASEPKPEPEPVSVERQSLSSDSTGCIVRISKLNYENPGTDTREYLELQVTPPLVVDAGTVTFAGCGIESLDLFNGDSACQSYRSIPLGEVSIPDSGLLAVCAQDSELGAACDVTTAGSSALRNGWLQNGPDDGVRVMGAAGVVAEYVYDRSAADCATSANHVLPTETGALPGSGEDDVAVLCGDQYSLVSATGVRPGTVHSCDVADPLASVDDSTTGLGDGSNLEATGASSRGVSGNGSQASGGTNLGDGGASGVAADGATGGTLVPAPEVPLGSARFVGEITTTTPTHVADAMVDAGAEPIGALQTEEPGGRIVGPPDALSCAVGTPRFVPSLAPPRCWVLLFAGLLVLARRRR